MIFIISFSALIILISFFIMQTYQMLMLITEVADLSLFNDKTVTDFFKHFNNLFKKHDIFKKSLKIYQLSHYCNAEHADVIHFFLKYIIKN